jgi:hypothetical protein
MIIVVCTDDAALVAIARASSQSHPAVFGNYYQIYTQQIPQLAAAENLFLIAHGAYAGDDNNPVIGDARNAFYVNAVELFENIRGLFPVGYSGNVYIDACESADHDEETFSFCEVFLTQIQAVHGGNRVFGRNGAVRGMIAQPGDAGWVEATL